MGKTIRAIFCFVLAAAFLLPRPVCADPAAEAASRIEKFGPEIARLNEAPAPEPGGILLVGSSIFRKWKSCAADLAPLPVTNRAFGGSQTDDQLYFFNRLIPSSHAALLVWYCGSNDINASQDQGNGSKTPEAILQRTREWIRLARAALPHSRILLCSVIRAPQKRGAGLLGKVDEVNKGLMQLAASIPGVSYVDINPSLENGTSEPLPECYVADKLHLTREGYRRIAGVLKPVIKKEWIPSPEGKP